MIDLSAACRIFTELHDDDPTQPISAGASHVLVQEAALFRSILSTFNYHFRLRGKSVVSEIARASYSSLLPCPSPCEYVDDKNWLDASPAEEEKRWLGHGYFWKSSDASSLDKDVGSLDFDSIESGYYPLLRAKVLFADYAQLCKDFPFLDTLPLPPVSKEAKDSAGASSSLDTRREQAISAWLLRQTAFLSAGQLKRIAPGGDLYPLLDFSQPLGQFADSTSATASYSSSELSSMYPRLSSEIQPPKIFSFRGVTSDKCAVRLKGGGRTSEFFINDTYAISLQRFPRSVLSVPSHDAEAGGASSFIILPVIRMQLLDVKGVGVASLQTRGFDYHANGFLPLTDALKELAYQRLIQRIAEITAAEEGPEMERVRWQTVKTLAIIYTGLKFCDDVANPATGFVGDRCVLVIRQAHSRLMCSPSDPVFYAVSFYCSLPFFFLFCWCLFNLFGVFLSFSGG